MGQLDGWHQGGPSSNGQIKLHAFCGKVMESGS